MRHHEEDVMGTVVTFDLFDERGFNDRAVDEVFARAAAMLHDVDEVFSTWKPQSPVSRLRRGEIDVASAPPQVAHVLDLCSYAKEVSGGWFDPWSMPGGVDPTGYVKGWAAQSSLAVLASLGATGAIVNAAGDVAVAGRPTPTGAFRVGVVNPFDRSVLVCVVEAVGAVATSGDYERGAHLVNPFSADTTTALASATVTGPDLGLADALATALVVGGLDALPFIEALHGYEALLIGHDAKWSRTSSFPLASGVAL
jgi:thiamine biosynthesis lipoprotein